MNRYSLHDNFLISDYLSPLDLAIVAFFVGLYLLLPKFLTRNAAPNSERDYLLMNNGLSLPLFVATIVASWYGGIFGVTQIAFNKGIYSFITQGLFWYVAYFLFAIFLAKKVRQKKVMSLPELLGLRFGEKARKLAAIILFLHALPVTYAISVGLFLQLALGLDFHWAVISGVMIVAVYTSFGGFRGVVITDCIQFILMFAAVIMVVFASMMRFGGISFLKDALPHHYFTWDGSTHTSQALIWLFIACTSTFIHPVFYQRCLAAKSDKVAIHGIFMAMGFFLLFDMCTTLGGMYAKALIPTADSSKAYMLLGMQLFPSGIRGIFVSGVLATILSTLDSFMFVASTSISYDLFGSIIKANAHKITMMLCAVLVVVVSLFFGSDFEKAWLFMEGAFSTSLLVPVLASVLFKTRFLDRNFLMPALGSLSAFGLASVFYQKQMITLEPFYVAHIASLLLFVLTLKIKTQSKPKLADFANG